MKKKYAIILVLVISMLIVSISACGNESINGNISAPEATAEPEESISLTPDMEESEFEVGSANGGVYTNEFLGIGCDLDENWTFYSDEDLEELNGAIADGLKDEELAEAYAESMESGKTIYDMYAGSSDGLATICITIENLGVVYGATLDESDYIDILMDMSKESLETQGATNIALEKTTAAFLATELPSLDISGEISDISFFEKIICIKKGNYMASVIITSFYEDATDDIAEYFYALQ